ncbi:MAG: M42 family metallopeptidase [Candidatus Bipolaricaulia bacterium]
MEKERIEFLERFMGTMCPTGFEEEASAVWKAEADLFAERTWKDVLGNTFAVINEAGSPKIVLTGHVDEIGLMITYVDDQGFLSFQTLGGWDPQVLPGQRVRIRTKDSDILGLIGRKAIHVMTPEDRKKVVKIEDLWIDICVKDKEEALSLVEIGDPAVVDYGFAEVRNGTVVARALDDRIGAFVVLEALRQLSTMNPKAAVYAVATTQEEIGARGATVGAFGLDPAVTIAVDVGQATDTPSMNDAKIKHGELSLGKGPQVTRGPNINPELFRRLIEAGKANDIPIQVEGYPRVTPTDGGRMQVVGAGNAAAVLGIPNRYMHSPCELVHLDDVENASKLIAHTVAGIDGDTSFIPE